MRINDRHIIVTFYIIAIVLSLVIITLPESNIRLFICIPFCMFLPGYMVFTIVFPDRKFFQQHHELLYFFFLSLSIFLIAIATFMFRLLPCEITLNNLLLSLSTLTIILSFIALGRKRAYSPQIYNFGTSVSISTFDTLLIVDILSILLFLIIIYVPSNVLRIIGGIPFVIFFPGYTLICALFINKKDLSDIEIIALSFGMSLPIVACIGLGLNYTNWGIRLMPSLICILCFILIMSLVAWFRQSRITKQEIPEFHIVEWKKLTSWIGKSALDKTLSVILVLALLGTVGSFIFTITNPKIGEKFTEFYILGANGKAADYPTKLKDGNEGWVTIGIINHEYASTEYSVELTLNETVINTVGPFELNDSEKLEEPVSFTPLHTGENQKLEFLLYLNKEEEPSYNLHLWIDVAE